MVINLGNKQVNLNLEPFAKQTVTTRSQDRYQPALVLINCECTAHASRMSVTQIAMVGFILIAVTRPLISFCLGHISILKLVNKEDYGFKSMFPWKQPIISAI
jgi:hypothetical protein